MLEVVLLVPDGLADEDLVAEELGLGRELALEVLVVAGVKLSDGLAVEVLEVVADELPAAHRSAEKRSTSLKTRMVVRITIL